MQMPAYEQVRILTDQKHPKLGAAPYRGSYYAQARAAIRSHYAHQRSPMAIADYQRRIQASNTLPHCKANNLRVLDSFANSPQADRHLVLGPRPESITRPFGNFPIDLRVRFDIEADEDHRQKHIFYNLLVAPIDEEIARMTLELAYRVLSDDGILMQDLEYVDLVNGKTLRWTRPRKSTLTKAEVNAKWISTVWPTL
jgi:hypothetical protein